RRRPARPRAAAARPCARPSESSSRASPRDQYGAGDARSPVIPATRAIAVSEARRLTMGRSLSLSWGASVSAVDGGLRGPRAHGDIVALRGGGAHRADGAGWRPRPLTRGAARDTGADALLVARPPRLPAAAQPPLPAAEVPPAARGGRARGTRRGVRLGGRAV